MTLEARLDHQPITKKAIDAVVSWTGRRYDIRIEGAELLEMDEPAILAFKHQTMTDFFAALYALRMLNKEAALSIKKSWFQIPVIKNFLVGINGIPTPRQKDEGYDKNGSEMRKYASEVIRTLKAGGWLIYAPEGTRVRGRVGDEVHVEPLLLAQRLSRKGQKVNAYIVGIEYKPEKGRPIWWAGTTITFRAEPYQTQDKTADQIGEDVKAGMARLSGLEYRVKETSPQK
ncbi:1-acyl-sn-glycerol-3-phosphate acyltransferase [Candidatus Woesearchaeota archaeon]|nr:1-acyl-sn-glycerol-3-phosphate acyltransferase [Candidatus Woesearchaeota archaeon]